MQLRFEYQRINSGLKLTNLRSDLYLKFIFEFNGLPILESVILEKLEHK